MTFVRTLRLLVAPLLAFSIFATGGATPSLAATTNAPAVLDSKLRIHPLLQATAQADPTALVRVIVQKTRPDVKSALVLSTIPGAQLLEEFNVIPAFVATLPQSAIPALANVPGVRYVSPDGAVEVISGEPSKASKEAAKPKPPKPADHAKHALDASKLATTYPVDTGASSAWSTGKDHFETGAGIGVAFIDSGVDASHPDLDDHLLAINVNRNSQNAGDGYGHGTHVAGIIGGHDADGKYIGIAPNATLISVKVSDDSGAAYVSDLLRGLDWVAANKDAYHIRVVNVSASVTIPESYATSPVDAAVEHLWQQNVTVVTSAGNLGSAQDAVWYAPGNDPRVLTVGCLDDNQTVNPSDDSLCPISSRGVTEDGFAKPDLVAPGRKIVSTLSGGVDGHASSLATEFPERLSADGRHISLSGTSMSAPIAAGAIALLLEHRGGLTPDQLKYILTSTARTYPGQPDHAGALDISAALAAADRAPSPDHLPAPLPVGGVAPANGASTILWDGARWSSTYWTGARWSTAYWDGARWTATYWDGARWTSAYWDGARWSSSGWDGARWSSSSTNY